MVQRHVEGLSDSFPRNLFAKFTHQSKSEFNGIQSVTLDRPVHDDRIELRARYRKPEGGAKSARVRTHFQASTAIKTHRLSRILTGTLLFNPSVSHLRGYRRAMLEAHFLKPESHL